MQSDSETERRRQERRESGMLGDLCLERRREERRDPTRHEVLVVFEDRKYSLIPVIVYSLDGRRVLYTNVAAQKEFGDKLSTASDVSVRRDYGSKQHRDVVSKLAKTGDTHTTEVVERNNKCYKLHYARCARWIILEVFDASLYMFDRLTNVPNRWYFEQTAARVLAEVRREQKDTEHTRTLAIFFLDLNRFKEINDRWGHAAADEILIEFVRRLRSTTRRGESTDLFARRSGDEFLALARVWDEADARAFAARIHAALEAPFSVMHQVIEVTVSIGFHMASPADTVETIITKADAAMYRAKQRRGNVTVMF